MPADRRGDIARKAAAARWAKKPEPEASVASRIAPEHRGYLWRNVHAVISDTYQNPYDNL